LLAMTLWSQRRARACVAGLIAGFVWLLSGAADGLAASADHKRVVRAHPAHSIELGRPSFRFDGLKRRAGDETSSRWSSPILVGPGRPAWTLQSSDRNGSHRIVERALPSRPRRLAFSYEANAPPTRL